MEQSNITAIVILYRSKHLVKKLIDNIRSKITNLDEIVLVDNSKEDLSEFGGGMVKIINPGRNIGYGAAINLALKIVSNENIIIMNPDIRIIQFSVKPREISAPLFIMGGLVADGKQSLSRNPTVLYDLIRFCFLNLSVIFTPLRFVFPTPKLYGARKFQKVQRVQGDLMVSTKSTLETLGGFDELFFLFYEEVDLCRRAHKKGVPVLVTPLISYERLPQKASLQSLDIFVIKQRAEIESWLRYHKKYSNPFHFRLATGIMRMWARIIVLILSFIEKKYAHPKLSKKKTQYKIYYDFLKKHSQQG